MDDQDRPQISMVNFQLFNPQTKNLGDNNLSYGSTKSSAQVESFVRQQTVRQNSGGLKPGGTRSNRIIVRVTPREHSTIVGQAYSARLTLSQYVRIVLLKNPGLDPERNRALLRSMYQLSQHSSNLQQIVKQANMGVVDPYHAIEAVLAMRQELSDAYNAVRAALTYGKKYEDEN